jgi:hypothetical protein
MEDEGVNVKVDTPAEISEAKQLDLFDTDPENLEGADDSAPCKR